jgi:hypothetical protein
MTIPSYGHPQFQGEYVGLPNGQVQKYDPATGHIGTENRGQTRRFLMFCRRWHVWPVPLPRVFRLVTQHHQPKILVVSLETILLLLLL